MPIKLTDQEEKIILKLREDAAREKRDRELFLRRIRAAADFAEWMNEEGAGATYSTFCDDFGYEAIEGEDRPRTYQIVLEIIKLASSTIYPTLSLLQDSEGATP